MSARAAEVRAFWFGELRDGMADDGHRKRWFASDAARDEEIRERFGPLLTAALRGELGTWLESPEDALSLVIVCDQFSRQIHRGRAEAYAADPMALDTARRLIRRGEDTALGLDQRAFLYMPFQHSESRLDQHTSVGVYTGLRDRVADDPRRRHAEGFLDHARAHRDIVLRFGRFPHRNAVLGRESTAAEREFLQSASSFGQGASSLDSQPPAAPSR